MLTSRENGSTMTTTQRIDSFHKPTFTPFSLIVDDVDARTTEEDDNQMLHKLLTDTTLDLRPCSQYSKEQCDARIRQIKVEAESRKIEFARLLDEHAQVIRRLKHLEEDGAALATGTTHA